MDTTIKWSGTTTFRLKAKGVVIFLDTWLERPSVLPKYLDIEDVSDVDYIFISHAHFDHLPGADRIALKTEATVIANGETINLLRTAGVPEEQLLPVAGGERVPLYTRAVREAARRGEVEAIEGPPGAPKQPAHSLAALSVHIWPSLHCLMPGVSHADVPEVMDAGKVYTETSSHYACTLDITRGMKYGLLRIGEHVPAAHRDAGLQSFVEYLEDESKHHNLMSNFDGGQLMYNFIIDDKALLWSAHLGGYEGILRFLEPKPDVLIQVIAGRANLDGRPFVGSAAQFAVKVVRWLEEPKRFIWCLHDESPIKPFRVDTDAATRVVEHETESRIVSLRPGKVESLFDAVT